MADIRCKYKRSHLCFFNFNNSLFLKFVFALIILKDCKGSVIFYDDTSEGEADRGPWVPSNPFIGHSFPQKLMEARGTIGDWERAQLRRGHIHSQFIDDVFKMEQGATFKRGDVRSWVDNEDTTTAFYQEPCWSQMLLPIMLSFFALISVLGLSLVIFIWLKSQMSNSEDEKEGLGEGIGGDSENIVLTEGRQWIYHPVIKPMTTQQCENLPVNLGQQPPVHTILPEVMTAKCLEGDEKRAEPIRIKAKGLLERRGSSASLTIDLLHPSQENLSVTPTRECTAEEYLLSAGNVLSRGQLRSCLKDVRPLHREFWDLPLNHPEHIEVLGSGVKNRYRTIIPNENTRVHLPTEDKDNDPLAGYINANYIRGYDGEEKAFIATQGPLAHTVNDFWLMVWSEKAPVIVMITKLWEKSRSKCEPYFPNDPGISVTYGSITVTVASVHIKDGYIVRHLDLQKEEDLHRVVHFWFDSWPDHKTPANAHSLLCLAKDVDVSRFLGPSQRRNSPSTWPIPNREKYSGIVEQAKSGGESTELLSPCPEISSPSSLKDTSPILNFGRLEFQDDEPEEENKCRSREDLKGEHLVCLCDVPDVFTPTSVDKTVEAVNLQSVPKEDLKVNQLTCFHNTTKDTRHSSGFFQHYSYNTEEVMKCSSLPQDSSITHSRVDLENIRSKSVDIPPTWISSSKDFSNTIDQKLSDRVDVFDFDKLSIDHDSFRSKSTDHSHTVDEISRQDSLGGKNDIKRFDNQQAHSIVSTSSPNWTSMTSPNLTQSFDKSTSKLSVDSPSWALDLSPHLSSERNPLRSHSTVESPNLTHSSNESKHCTHSSDSSKHWTHSSMGSSVWAQSSEDSPRWLEKDEEPPVSGSRIKSPGWFSSFDRSPLFSRRSREGSISMFWGDMQRGTAAGPVVVHCSAGIGRTGCFIAICVGINQLLGENNVDILGIVCRMRYDRGGMVQTAEQYEFIHRALTLFERSLPNQSGE